MNPQRMWLLRGVFIVFAAAGAFLALAGPAAHAGGTCHEEPVTSDSTTVVHIEGVCFSPAIVQIGAGETVTWVNDHSKAPHSVTGASTSWGSFDELAPGKSWSHQFTTQGTYPYYCFLHPGMVGAVVVGDANTSGESVSLAGGGQSNRTVDAASAGGPGSFDQLWLFVPLVAAAAGGAAAGGFALGMRRR